MRSNIPFNTIETDINLAHYDMGPQPVLILILVHKVLALIHGFAQAISFFY